MLKILQPLSLKDRLDVWTFKSNWIEEKAIVELFYTRIMNAYTQIETSKYFLQMIGYVLTIGNILNGGTPKGQADGFDLSVFSKIASMKDNTNQNLMQLILKKIYANEPDLHKGVKELYKSVNIKEVDTKYMKTKTGELQTMYGKKIASFAKVTGSGEPNDNFMIVFE